MKIGEEGRKTSKRITEKRKKKGYHNSKGKKDEKKE
jgi:hypothetical protein